MRKKPINDKNIIEYKNIIEEVINSLITQAEKERLKDPKYKELFKKSTDFGSLLRETEHKMVCSVLDACEILTQKFNIKKIDNEVFNFLLSLPLLTSLIKKQIEEKEGHSCCVDKTYYILSNLLKTKLNKKLK